MPYTPKYKPGDNVTLDGEILAVVDFYCKQAEEKRPMYLVGMTGSWFWAWAEVVDGVKSDPVPPPCPPVCP